MAFLDHLDTYMYRGSRSNFQSIQVDGSLYLQISSFICLFLFIGMRVWPIFRARLLISLWDFHHWIPGKKSHNLDYLLGLFRAIGPEVIFIGDFEPCGPHVAILCGVAVDIVISFGLTCGIGL